MPSAVDSLGVLATYRVSLGGIGFGEQDADGTLWVVSGLAGWHASGSSGQVTQRTGRHGAWRDRARYAARGLTLTGSIITPEPGMIGEAVDRLAAAIPLDVPQDLTVLGVTGDDRLVRVRQEGAPDIQIVSPFLAVFSIGLVAADPLKYSALEHIAATALPSSTGGLVVPHVVPFSVDAVSVSGVATVENRGNIGTCPRLIVYGPVTSPRITNQTTGEVLLIRLTVDDGRYLDLDLAEHTAYLDGTASRRGFVSGDWFELVPGLNSVAFNAPTYSADASLQIVWRDAWK